MRSSWPASASARARRRRAGPRPPASRSSTKTTRTAATNPTPVTWSSAPPGPIPRPRISAPLRGPRGSSPPSRWPHHDREHHPRCNHIQYPAQNDAGVLPMKKLLIAGAALSLVLGGFVGHAASTLTPDSVLLNGAPCTITNNGLSSAGTCSGAFVQTAATPAPTPTPTSTPAPTPTPAPAPTSTPAPPLGGITPLYAATSFWNLPIGPPPLLAPNSAALVHPAP